MGISNLMDKLHHKHEEAPTPSAHATAPAPEPRMAVPRPPARPEPRPVPPPVRHWGLGSHEGDDMIDGVIVDIGEEMSVNLPIKKRMSMQEFLKIAERVKRMEELLSSQPGQDYPMTEYN